MSNLSVVKIDSKKTKNSQKKKSEIGGYYWAPAHSAKIPFYKIMAPTNR